jgi:hypothetical protein
VPARLFGAVSHLDRVLAVRKGEEGKNSLSICSIFGNLVLLNLGMRP